MKPDRFLIGYSDSDSGYQTNVRPWLIPDNAYYQLENCYVYRGRTRKRLGSVLMGTTQYNSRLGYVIGTTDGSGDASGTVPGAIFAVGQAFLIGSDVYTVNVSGTPATLLSTNPSATFTYNLSTGDYTVTNADPGTDIIFYSATPVMGLPRFFVPLTTTYLNMAFDTQFSYVFDPISNIWVAVTSGDTVWTGTDLNFFWSTNYQGADTNTNWLWTTNYNPSDGIRYFDGTTWTTATMQIDSAGDTVSTCLAIAQFKNRLLLFNTIEDISSTETKYFNRVRYSALGDPTASNAWRQDIPGNGGAIDAPVQQAIVTVQFIKDRLIVYFENSTFELVYTGNQVQPFVWQKINTELGAEATFSEVPFDRQVFGVDNLGIHICNGSNVERIDEKIPQIAFNFSDTAGGRERIYGIRDYYNELVYWTYRNALASTEVYFPNKMLVYNYVNSTWATFDDSITCFGYFPYTQQTPGATWGDTTSAWQDLTILWNAGSDATTTPAIQSVIAGNQQGYVYVMLANVTSNASALQVTDVDSYSDGKISLLSINHNLAFGDFVLLISMNGMTFTDSNGNDLPTVIGVVTNNPILDGQPNTIDLTLLDNFNNSVVVAGTYTGGGTIARVSNITATTKQYNFYTEQDRNCYISKVDFLVDATSIGQVTVDFFVSSSQSSLLSGSAASGALPGNSILETAPYALSTFEQFQDRLWHPIYFYAEGECVQFSILMSPIQMFNYVIDDSGNINYTALQDFQLHAMVIYAQPTSSRMQ